MSAHSIYAAPLVFFAGAATSIGPCVAPRFIAVAGMSAGESRRRAAVLAGAFTAGLTAVYAAFGSVSWLLSKAVLLSPYTYAVVALVLAAGGVISLWRGQSACDHTHRARVTRGGAGSAFLLGTSFAMVVSPCCTPVVVGILAYTSAAGSAAYASALLACFALGHALPLLPVALGIGGVSTMLSRDAIRQAAGVVSATLMLGLAAYYAVLA